MSRRFPFPTKFRPTWWIGNADDPPPQGYSTWSWFMRNPMHNLLWYVIGCADRRFKLLGVHRPSNFRDTGGWHAHVLLQGWPPFVCPFISYHGARLQFYLGWRHNGPFGVALRNHGSAR